VEDHQAVHQPQALQSLKANQPKPRLQNNNKRKRKLHQPKKKKEWIWEDSSIDLLYDYLNFTICTKSSELIFSLMLHF
jgi:hypothetical protein